MSATDMRPSGALPTRRLGELEVSAIGLGCMPMSWGYNAAAADPAEVRVTLRRAVELGVTLFDTADVYGPYTNESIIRDGIGRVLGEGRRYDLCGFSYGALLSGHVAAQAGGELRSVTLVGAGALGPRRQVTELTKVRSLDGEARVAAGAGAFEGVELVQKFAAGALALLADAGGNDAFHDETAGAGITAGGKRLVARAEEARLGEPPLQFGQDDVRRQQALVAGVVALEE